MIWAALAAITLPLCLALLGSVVLVFLNQSDRRLLLALTPVLGAAIAVDFLHLQTLAMPLAAAPWILPVLAGTAAVLGWPRRKPTIRVGAPRWRYLATLLVGTVVSIVVPLIASLRANTNRVIMPTASHDAFYFVEVARWLAAHTGTTIPSMAGSPATALDPPAYGPAFGAMTVPMRYGQELLFSWLTSVLGINPVDVFTPWIAAYCGLICVAAAFTLRAFRVPPAWALAGAVATAVSFPVLTQFAAQNADSLLGISLGIATVGAVRLGVVAGLNGERLPPWIPGILLAATAGTYFELLVFVGPTLVCVVLFAPRELLMSQIRRGLAIVAIGLVAAPWAWIRAFAGFSFMQGFSGAAPGRMAVRQIVIELAGPLRGLIEPAVPGAAVGTSRVVLFVTISLGIILALVLAMVFRGSRALAVGVIVLGGGVLVYLALRGNTYMFDRAVDILSPFVILVVVAGAYSASRLAGSRSPRTGTILAAVFGLLSIAWFAGGVRNYVQDISWNLSHRVVDQDFDEAQRWVSDVAKPDGRNIAVVVPDFFDELWIVDALRNYNDVSYPILRGDLGYLGQGAPQTFENSGRHSYDYYLLGRGVDLSIPSSAIVKQNKRFELVDVRKVQYALAFPAPPDGLWSHNLSDSPSGREILGAATARIAIRVDPQSHGVQLDLDELSPNAIPTTTRLNVGAPGWTAEWLRSGQVQLTRAAGSSDSATLQIGDLTPAPSDFTRSDGTFFIERVQPVG